MTGHFEVKVNGDGRDMQSLVGHTFRIQEALDLDESYQTQGNEILAIMSPDYAEIVYWSDTSKAWMCYPEFDGDTPDKAEFSYWMKLPQTTTTFHGEFMDGQKWVVNKKAVEE